MNASFVDSNIFIYAFFDEQDNVKQNKAKAIISKPELIISTQVINEVSTTLLRKAGYTEPQIQYLIDSFYEKYQVQNIDINTMLLGSELRQNYYFSFWDSIVVASALLANAKILYSEDMQNGLKIYGRLTIVQPF